MDMGLGQVLTIALVACLSSASALPADPGSEGTLTQVPDAMHIPMAVHPQISVGARSGDIVGADNGALQAAVDYIAGLGGGLVRVEAGEYLMRDSLHLRSGVTVRGVPGKTVLRKAASVSSPLRLDGDYGEEQFTPANPAGFAVGEGVAVWDANAGGFHATVARIIGQNGSTFAISLPLNADCMVEHGAQAATVFPVVSGYSADRVRIEGLTIEGGKEQNVYLNGCRGGGIFLYRCSGAVIEHCVVRDYNGDGISFQQCNDAKVLACVSEGNTGLGIHPGSGSQRPLVRQCVARNNGQDGLYLCWRVKRGVFEDNLLEDNGRYGISIGHKDTDNLLRNNQVRDNGRDGVCFRNETGPMAGNRNRLVDNLIENNGQGHNAAGIDVQGQTRDLVFENNVIRDTRSGNARKQSVGIRIESKAGPIKLEHNQIQAHVAVDDLRPSASQQ